MHKRKKEANNFHYLGSHELKFYCPCSHQRMVENFQKLPTKDIDEIFQEQDSVQTRCDYCNTIYDIARDSVLDKKLH